MITIASRQLRNELDAHLDSLIERFYREVPFASHQRDAAEVQLDYYKRHNIETILRLRLKRTVDAETIKYFTLHDPVLAKLWSEYTAEEMLHDRLFARDLEAVGVEREEIYATEPMLATKLLQGYFYYGLEHEGRPLASLTSSYVIEYTTTRTQPRWLDNLARSLGEDRVAGARAHVGTDVDLNHCDLVWRALSTLLLTPEDVARMWAHVDAVYELFCMYFRELYQSTIAKRDEQPKTAEARHESAHAG